MFVNADNESYVVHTHTQTSVDVRIESIDIRPTN